LVSTRHRSGLRAGRCAGTHRPTMTGGFGFCTGFGQVRMFGKSTISPRYSGSDLVQISFIASICSRIFLKRVLKTVP